MDGGPVSRSGLFSARSVRVVGGISLAVRRSVRSRCSQLQLRTPATTTMPAAAWSLALIATPHKPSHRRQLNTALSCTSAARKFHLRRTSAPDPNTRDDMSRRRRQFGSRRIYVRPRTGPQSAHLWWPAVAKLQAASVPIARGSCAPGDIQTDRGIAQCPPTTAA